MGDYDDYDSAPQAIDMSSYDSFSDYSGTATYQNDNDFTSNPFERQTYAGNGGGWHHEGHEQHLHEPRQEKYDHLSMSLPVNFDEDCDSRSGGFDWRRAHDDYSFSSGKDNSRYDQSTLQVYHLQTDPEDQSSLDDSVDQYRSRNTTNHTDKGQQDSEEPSTPIAFASPIQLPIQQGDYETPHLEL